MTNTEVQEQPNQFAGNIPRANALGCLLVVLLFAALLAFCMMSANNKECTRRYYFADGPMDVPCGSDLDHTLGGGK